MALTLDAVSFLASPAGEALLTRLSADDLSDANTLKLLTTLRKQVPQEQAGAALEMARLRLKAVDKFGGDAVRLLFTREALEQASDPDIRRYRAKRIAAEASSVVDACCGTGADSLAFAAAGTSVTGLDSDPVRVAMARCNAAALGLTARFALADVRDGIPEADAAFFDPARRDEQGRRIYDVERYIPPLSLVRGWAHPLVAVKLSPGVELAQVAGYAGQVEFISVDGDLKEAVLWRGAGLYGLRATLLSHGEEYHWETQGAAVPAHHDLSAPRAWLIEPDAALIRAGLVQDAAACFAGAQLDATTAYFTADDRPASPWVRAWRVRDWMPFNLKKLRAYLKAGGVGRVTIKKRGTAVTPDELLPRLKLVGGEARTLVLTRCRGQQIAIICDEQPV